MVFSIHASMILIFFSRNYGYYNLELGLDCNLGKGLRKNKRNDQLVKYKNAGLYLQLYIPMTIRNTFNIHEVIKSYNMREI